MSWDNLMAENAAKEGWRLVTVVDSGSTHPYYMVARTAQSGHKDDRAAMGVVTAMAHRNSPLHKHALQLVMTSKMKPQPKAKRK